MEKWYNIDNIEIVEAELTSREGTEIAVKTENLVLSTSILKKAAAEGITIYLFDDKTKQKVHGEFAKDYVNFAQRIISKQAIINAKDDGKPSWA